MRSLFALAAMLVLFAGAARAQDVAVSFAFADTVDIVNRATGTTISSQTLTLAAHFVDGTNGMAIDPTTGTVWIVIRDSGDRYLCTVNINTGVCTLVGLFSDSVASIAFHTNGTLYAVTGDGALNPERLYTVNKANAAMTQVAVLGNGSDGEAIAYNPTDNMIYHLSGINAPLAFETINPTTFAITPIAHTITVQEYQCFTWDPVGNRFLAGTGGSYYAITAAGASTLLGAFTDTIKGIIVLPPAVPSLTTSTQNLNLGTTTQGTASTSVNFTVNGSNLTANLTVTGFTGVVVSLMPAAGFGASVSLTPAAGTVPVTTIYARIQASAPVGPIAGNIVVASTGATSINIAANGTVNAPPVPEINVLRGANPIADGGVDAQGTQTAGAALSLTYTIQNLGNVALNLTGTPRVVVTAGANISNAAVMTQPGASIVPAANANFTINYQVTTTGSFDFTVSIASDDADENPYNWTVSGTGQGTPEIAVIRAPNAIADGGTDNAGNQLIGSAMTLTYDISNSGTDVLNITTPVNVTNNTGCMFTVTMQPGSPVAMATSTQLIISVTPTVLGAFSLDISFVNDDLDENPYNWTVTGNGFGVPEISVSQAGLGIPDGGTDALGAGNPAGQAIIRTYDINNVGSSPLGITLPVSIIGATNCVATVTTPPSATVAPSSTTQLTLSITPAGAGAFSLQVSFVNDDANESPYNFTVSGSANAVGGTSGSGGGGGCTAGAGSFGAAFFLVAALLRRRRRAA